MGHPVGPTKPLEAEGWDKRYAPEHYLYGCDPNEHSGWKDSR
jgi:hypothetical protein